MLSLLHAAIHVCSVSKGHCRCQGVCLVQTSKITDFSDAHGPTPLGVNCSKDWFGVWLPECRTWCRNLHSAGFQTFWEVLQYYPKDYVVYQQYLQSDSFVQLQGTVSKSSVGGPYLQLQIQVDPIHNPLLNPPEPLGILSPTEMTRFNFELNPHASEDLDSDDLSNDDINDDDDEQALLDELHSDSAELSTASELNEHGRSFLPEQASTSAPMSPSPSTSSPPGARLGNSGPEQQLGQQVLEVKQFFGGRFGRYGASKIAMANPAGSRVQVHCKVSPGAAPGKRLELACGFASMIFLCASDKSTSITCVLSQQHISSLVGFVLLARVVEHCLGKTNGHAADAAIPSAHMAPAGFALAADVALCQAKQTVQVHSFLRFSITVPQVPENA